MRSLHNTSGIELEASPSEHGTSASKVEESGLWGDRTLATLIFFFRKTSGAETRLLL